MLTSLSVVINLRCMHTSISKVDLAYLQLLFVNDFFSKSGKS